MSEPLWVSIVFSGKEDLARMLGIFTTKEKALERYKTIFSPFTYKDIVFEENKEGNLIHLSVKDNIVGQVFTLSVDTNTDMEI